MPKACVKLFQYYRLFGCSTPLLPWPERRNTVLLVSMITLSANRRTQRLEHVCEHESKRCFNLLVYSMGGKTRRAVPVHGHRVNLQSGTQMPPQLLRRKWIPGEKQPELSSRSLVPGYFLSGLANYYSPCRNNCRTNPIWPSFFSFPFTSVQTVHNLLFCPVESRAWIDDLMNLNRAQQIIAVNLAPAN